MLQVTTSKSYQVRNGFSFAALTSTGAVLYWAGNETMAVQSVVSSGATAVAVNRYAVAALTSTGQVRAAGIDAFITGCEAYQSGAVSLQSIAGNEGAFAGITATGGVVAFGALANGGDVQVSDIANHLLSGVVAIVASAASFTALKSDGTVFTWGNKHCGGGVSSLTRTDLQGIVMVFATRTAFAGLTNAGKVLTWGDLNGAGTPRLCRCSCSPGCTTSSARNQSLSLSRKTNLWWCGVTTGSVAMYLLSRASFRPR
jgi:hypothetical protein